ncbi:MAG: ABC transporter ATP-binding protein [Gammaproteobacteria bacterium]|nr:ABC transporter ATP-binding protein [Gammaproteobacteria bacterium]MBU1624484.1 ABC transporter ATP-binding protein [Gammaproteobacteria bacterium]MBU1982328.1 ABC transporter ATP-binding protein [Gammaproteobacteria bacterium]
MIIVDDVYKRYQTKHGVGGWVLQGVTFTIPPKINVGLVGGNGAGKSTLLRLIGGVDNPTRGSIERNCRVSWPMGFGGGLQKSLTGRQNAKFVCRVHGHEADMYERLEFIEDFAELGGAFDEPINTYSSGMRSRLQFGLSLAFDFDVYISDEVTATGDAAFRKKAAAAFKQLSDHASLIMVSHGEGTLKQFCQAGIWLNDGKAVWFDDIEDALTAYRESQPEDVSLNLGQLPLQEERDINKLEARREKKKQEAMALLNKGRSGYPVTIEDDAWRSMLRIAKREGIVLAGAGQLKKLGYRIKPNQMPILRKKLTATSSKIVDLYDLHTQCERLQEQDENK